MKKLAVALITVAVLASLGAAWWMRLFIWESHTGYLGPAFSPDGRFVYVIVRETTGFTWGLGWEHFTPPAHAYPLSDRIALVRIAPASGNSETLEQWPSTPVSRRLIREYRNRVFNIMTASLRPGPGGTVNYTVEMSIPKVPSSETHRLVGTWADHGPGHHKGEWREEGFARAGSSEPVLFRQTEVFVLKGPEAFPSAVVVLDHKAMTARVVAKSEAYAQGYPNGPQVAELLTVSRKKDIERIADIKRVRENLVTQYRAQGLSDGEALLKSGRDLENLGYLPKSPRIVAQMAPKHEAQADASLPLFDVAEAELASGIFPDIERALQNPGAEIDKSMGKYVIHRDYSNSEKLNAFLSGGGHEFLVRYRSQIYRVEIRYRK